LEKLIREKEGGQVNKKSLFVKKANLREEGGGGSSGGRGKG